MSEFTFKTFLVGLGLPAVAAFLAIVAVITWTANRPRVGCLVGCLIFGGVYFAFYAWLGVAPISPINSEHYIVYAVGFSLLAGAAQEMLATPDWLRWRIRLVVAVASAVFLVPRWDHLLTARPRWILGLAAVIFESWNVLAILAKRFAGPALPIALAVIAFAGSVVLFQSGSAKFAQMLALAGAILFGVSIAHLRKSTSNILEGMVPAVAVLIPAWMMTGKLYTFSNVPNWSFALIVAAPFALALALIPLPKSISPRVQQWVALGMTCAVAGLAVLLAISSDNNDAEW